MQNDRYQRQHILPMIGVEGQKRLGAASIAVVGVGALGCVSADQLTRAGVGRLVLIDRDVVELSNLQRQVLYTESDAAGCVPKVAAAGRRLREVNSAVCIQMHAADITSTNISGLLSGCDVVVDGTDSFETRYLMNDWAVKEAKYYIYGGAISTRAMAMRLVGGGGLACLRCVFPQAPAPGTQPTCDTAGVLAAASAVAGSYQAALAIGAVVGGGGGDAGAGCSWLIEHDVWEGRSRRVEIRRDAQCPCCGEGRYDYLEGVGGEEAVRLCGTGTYQVWPAAIRGASRALIGLHEVGRRLAGAGATQLQVTEMMLRCTLPGGAELMLFGDGRALLRGAERPEVARSLYARYIGM